jgi:hypothetical protein
VLVFTDATQRDDVVSRVPDGWDVRALAVDLHGARVELP